MQIVIDIPERNYKTICETKALWETEPKNIIYAAIAKGIPLPKGHGGLVDVDALTPKIHGTKSIVAILEAPIIIEADRREEDDGFFDEIMDDESDGEVYEKIKEIIGKVKEKEKINPLDEYIPMVEEMKQMMRGDYPWNCEKCEHTEDECKDCYPELGYKNDKLKRDTEAVSEFVESDIFDEIMDNESEDEETYEKIKEIIEKVKEQET